jgi:hypothetical protein
MAWEVEYTNKFGKYWQIINEKTEKQYRYNG